MDEFMKLLIFSGMIDNITEGNIFSSSSDNTGMNLETDLSEIDYQVIGGASMQNNNVSLDKDKRDAMIARGNSALSDGEWSRATAYFNAALEQDKECSNAYLGLVMAAYKCSSKSNFEEFFSDNRGFVLENQNMKKYLRYCSADKQFDFIKKEIKKKTENILALRQKAAILRNRISANWDGGFLVLSTDGVVYFAPFAYSEDLLTPDRAFWGKYSVELYKSNLLKIFSTDKIFVGLCSDGSVWVKDAYGCLNVDVSYWKVIQAGVGREHILGLRSDGTVEAAGDNKYGQCNVFSWNNIVEVACENYHSIGLRKDGTVVAAGNNKFGQCDVTSWTDICSISTTYYYTLGLRKDGSVLATRWRQAPGVDRYYGQCEVGDWSDIIAISAGAQISVGLKSNGKVVLAGGAGLSEFQKLQKEVSLWEDVVAISAGRGCDVLAIRSDGRILWAGSSIKDGAWHNIKAFEQFENFLIEVQENRKEGKDRAQQQENTNMSIIRAGKIEAQIADIQNQISNLGFFQKSKRIELEKQLNHFVNERDRLLRE